jgi:hypothetical protein
MYDGRSHTRIVSRLQHKGNCRAQIGLFRDILKGICLRFRGEFLSQFLNADGLNLGCHGIVLIAGIDYKGSLRMHVFPSVMKAFCALRGRAYEALRSF